MRSGSISRVLFFHDCIATKVELIIIHLDILLPAASSNLPEATREQRLMTSYLVLLRMGFTFALGCHQLRRCALTAPFHPYPIK